MTLLRKHGYENIFYWKDAKDNEIDFIIKEGRKVQELIQVCAGPKKPSIKERELRSLLIGADELRCRNLNVITKSYKGKEKIDGYQVNYIPAYDWFLMKNDI